MQTYATEYTIQIDKDRKLASREVLTSKSEELDYCIKRQ